ncbi:MAG TPA: hypothetical protein DCY20_00130 [Firmicutes bacterium]|nr:hypothetical protein [Bacillota bacterium]
MLLFYQLCFFCSFFWIIATMVLGEVLDGLGDGDLDGLTLGFNFSTRSVIFGILLFGGFGWLTTNETQLSVVAIIICGLIIGLVGCAIFEYGVIKPLKRAQSTSSVKEEELVGKLATIIEPTSATQFGKANVVINGNTLTYSTKTERKEKINRGTSVKILGINSGFLLVDLVETEAVKKENKII